MPAGTVCCSVPNYTTRSYDLSGNTRWTADYFQGMPIAYDPTVADCDYATAAALPANTYANGTLGVGATLTANANGTLAVDGANPAINKSVLVKNEASPEKDGIYTVTATGSGAAKWVLTRRTDFDQAAEVIRGTVAHVVNGTANIGTNWFMTTSGTIVMGTTAINWETSLDFGTIYKQVNTQAVDNNCVYVGGMRVTNNVFHSWSVVAFDIDTGQFLWDYDCGGDVRKIQIDDSGNVVCMIDLGALNVGFTTLSTRYNQHFVRLQPDGTFIDDISFQQIYSPIAGGTTYGVKTMDFVVNEDGDYHVLGQAFSPLYMDLYEWIAPLSSAPTLKEFACSHRLLCTSINRIGGRDYVGSYAATASPTVPPKGSFLLKGKSQQACPAAITDFDTLYPDVLHDAAATTLTNSVSVAAAGTTQAGATLLVVGKNYLAMTGAAGAGVRFPTGAAGDMIGFDRNSSSGTNTFANYFTYPPTSGTLDFNPAITRNQGSSGTVWVCTAPGNWIESQNPRPPSFNMQSYFHVQGLAIDSSGNYRFTTGVPYHREVKLEPTGVPRYLNINAEPPRYQWICADSSDNSYTLCSKASSPVTILAVDSSGSFLWGHKHMGTGQPWLTAFLYPGCIAPMQMDPDGLHFIASGFDDSSALKGPVSKLNDQDFIANPLVPPPLVNVYSNGASSTYTTSRSGFLAIELIGAGAGSDDSASLFNGTDGVGAGSYFKIRIPVASGVVFTFSAPVGGLGANGGGTGSNGGDSTVTQGATTYTAGGGKNNGTGGTAGSGGDIMINGGNGSAHSGATGGDGGDAPFGGFGPAGATTGNDANPGTNPGAGASGSGGLGNGKDGGYGQITFSLQ